MVTAVPALVRGLRYTCGFRAGCLAGIRTVIEAAGNGCSGEQQPCQKHQIRFFFAFSAGKHQN